MGSLVCMYSIGQFTRKYCGAPPPSQKHSSNNMISLNYSILELEWTHVIFRGNFGPKTRKLSYTKFFFQN